MKKRPGEALLYDPIMAALRDRSGCRVTNRTDMEDAHLEIVFRKLDWKDGLKISDEQLNHLRVTNGTVLVANNPHEIDEMLQELNTRSKEVGLKINALKTKVVQSLYMLVARLQIDDVNVEEIDIYACLGLELNMSRNIKQEIVNRRPAAIRLFDKRATRRISLRPGDKVKSDGQDMLPVLSTSDGQCTLVNGAHGKIIYHSRCLQRAGTQA
ncbi:unnamed protein product [Gongylonema pulchrum]|uniref:Reverse transcriptase domain-containing protein n=1 Tax=Gongylonema pulchrum TaxID=637853 RepID=A0A183DU55_9BILA|nr:unnamed protein product [Gongylonema pulchrum]